MHSEPLDTVSVQPAIENGYIFERNEKGNVIPVYKGRHRHLFSNNIPVFKYNRKAFCKKVRLFYRQLRFIRWMLVRF